MWLAETEDLRIQHALNGLEFRVGNYKVDGKCGDTVYEFNGCKSIDLSFFFFQICCCFRLLAWM